MNANPSGMTEPSSPPRGRILIVLVGLLAAVIAAVVLLGGGSSEKDLPATAALLVEEGEGPQGEPGLIVSLEDPGLNEPRTAKDRASVTLECLDSGRGVLVRQDFPWPFSDDGGTGLPHVHQVVPPEGIAAIASCRLAGTAVRFEGSLR